LRGGSPDVPRPESEEDGHPEELDCEQWLLSRLRQKERGGGTRSAWTRSVWTDVPGVGVIDGIGTGVGSDELPLKICS